MMNKVKTVFVSDDFNALVSCISDLKFYPLKKNRIAIVAAAYMESRKLLQLLSKEFELEHRVRLDINRSTLPLNENTMIEACTLGDGQRFRGFEYDYLVIYNPASFTPELLKEVLKND